MPLKYYTSTLLFENLPPKNDIFIVSSNLNPRPLGPENNIGISTAVSDFVKAVFYFCYRLKSIIDIEQIMSNPTTLRNLQH